MLDIPHGNRNMQIGGAKNTWDSGNRKIKWNIIGISEITFREEECIKLKSHNIYKGPENDGQRGITIIISKN